MPEAPVFIVRLACVKHAASVRPEPGSNSPSRSPAPAEAGPSIGLLGCPPPRRVREQLRVQRAGLAAWVRETIGSPGAEAPGGPAVMPDHALTDIASDHAARADARTRYASVSSVFKKQSPADNLCGSGQNRSDGAEGTAIPGRGPEGPCRGWPVTLPPRGHYINPIQPDSNLRTRAGRRSPVASGRGVPRSCSLRPRAARAAASPVWTGFAPPTCSASSPAGP